MAAIQSVQVTKGGVTKTVQVGSKAYDNYISQGYTASSGSGASVPKTSTVTTGAAKTVASGNYVNINGAYFQQTSSGLAAVSDSATLQGLKSGKISATSQSATGGGADRYSSQIAGATPINPNKAPEQTKDFTGQVAGTNTDAWSQGVATEVATLKQQLTDAYAEQERKVADQIKIAQKKSDELAAKQENILKEANPQLGVNYEQEQQIIKNQLDAAEAASETLKQNFMDNQKAIAELETLWTEAMNGINQMKSQTGLASIRTPRINQAIDYYNARKGVLQAVMAARDDQINFAHSIIDNAAEKSAASKNEQISYYNALLSFYSGQQGIQENRIATLTQTEQKYIDKQIGILENDLAQAEETTSYIKQLMVNPATASLMQDANINLNMSVAQINEALAGAANIKEARDTANSMVANGYSEITQWEVTNKPEGTVQTITNPDGSKSYFYKAEKTSEGEIPTTREINGVTYQYNPTTGQWEQPSTRLPNTLYMGGVPVASADLGQTAGIGGGSILDWESYLSK